MEKFLFFLCCLAVPFVVPAQEVLQGRVIAADSKKGVGLANVYLSNTSVGTVTAEDGRFRIAPFPPGRYELIVSFVGYETYKLSVVSSRLPSMLEIVLQPKVTELQEVILEPYEKNGWDRWGKFFMENFVGTSANAADCKLLNREVIKFRFKKQQNMLQVFASEPLLFENRALGYKLRYDLTACEYDFSQRIFIYQGFPFFEEMVTGRSGLQRRWERRRADTYTGSLMHFMRSLYRNRLVEEHFAVRKLLKISEAEKTRVRSVYRTAMQRASPDGRLMISNTYALFPPDTAEYYRLVMQEPDKLNVLINKILPGDSIAYGIDSLTAGLYFKDHLHVVYTEKQLPVEYNKYNPSFRPGQKVPLTSELSLTIDQPLEVLSNGSYFEGLGLLTSGYWGWWEKIANMLPYHYKPPAR